MIDGLQAATGLRPDTKIEVKPRVAAPVEIRQRSAVIADKATNSAAGRAPAAVSLSGDRKTLSPSQKTWLVVGVSVAGAALGAAIGYFTGGRVHAGNATVNRIASTITSSLMLGVGSGFFTAAGLKDR
jgi:hypothetical protein